MFEAIGLFGPHDNKNLGFCVLLVSFQVVLSNQYSSEILSIGMEHVCISSDRALGSSALNEQL